MPQGKGVRCWGFTSADGEYAHCTREQFAGQLAPGADGSFAHRLRGPCTCGVAHGPEPPARSAAARRLPPVTTRYELHDTTGQLVGVHVRQDFLDTKGHPYRDKKFWWEQHQGRGAREMPLYRLADHVVAPRAALRIICEGEKAADALRAALSQARRLDEMIALGTVTGADACPCDDSLRPLVGYPVAFWPDHHDKGRQHMERIAARLVALGARAPQWMRWPDAPPKGDAADYFLAGGTVERLLQLVTDKPAPSGADTSALADEAPTVWQPTIQTAHDLMAKELPPVRWVVESIIPEGVALLAGKAKKGKSTLMLHIAMSVAQGAVALGRLTTERADVLYLALEDNERRMQKRIRGMLGAGENVPGGLQIAYQWLPLELGGSTALERYLDCHPHTHLVIVDTLHHVRTAPRGNSNGYAEDYAACRELLRIAGARRIAIVVLTHLRKAPADDPFDEINATGGLLAGVDNALVMRPAGRDGLMELHRRGREFEDDSTLALRGDKKTLRWSFAGQAEEVMRSSQRQAIIDVLPREGASEGMRPGEIADVLGEPVGNIRKLLFSLKREKEAAIICDSRGMYYARGNGGNGGNAGGQYSQESVREAELSLPHPVTADVTALPWPSTSGNAAQAHTHGPRREDVTTVTAVTGNVEGVAP